MDAAANRALRGVVQVAPDSTRFSSESTPELPWAHSVEDSHKWRLGIISHLCIGLVWEGVLAVLVVLRTLFSEKRYWERLGGKTTDENPP